MSVPVTQRVRSCRSSGGRPKVGEASPLYIPQYQQTETARLRRSAICELCMAQATAYRRVHALALMPPPELLQLLTSCVLGSLALALDYA